jgi:hypothetical protein
MPPLDPGQEWREHPAMWNWLKSLFSPDPSPAPSSQPASKTGKTADAAPKQAEAATPFDPFALDPIIKTLAATIYPAVQEEFGRGEAHWTAAAVDIRFDAEGDGFVEKYWVEKPGGSVASPELPSAAVEQIEALGSVRPTGGEGCWYGLVLRITAAGGCNMKLNYDANCAADPVFLDT